MLDIPQKTCYKCKQPFPATPEYFRINRTKRGGLEARCKLCHKIRKNPLPSVQDGEKRCTKCEEVFPATLTYFYRDRETKDGLVFRCKQCHKDDRNAGDYTERHRKYAQKHYYSHLEQNYARNRSYMLNLRQTNPEKARVLDSVKRQNRRARELSIGGSCTTKEIEAQYQQQKGKCYYCSKKMTQHHIEHVVPLSRGGTNDISNIILSCPSCKQKKGGKLPHEWPAGGRLM